MGILNNKIICAGGSFGLALVFAAWANLASAEEGYKGLSAKNIERRIKLGKTAPISEETKKTIEKVWDDALWAALRRGCIIGDYSVFNRLKTTYDKIEDNLTLAAKHISVDPKSLLLKEKWPKEKETDDQLVP